MQQTIQVEFNELSPTLLDEFIDGGELPNFRRLRDSSEVFVTDASGEANLEPWVQWPTLHTGISDHEHGIEQLGEESRVSGRGIGRELAGAGFKVGIFGSMNLDYGPLDAFTLPDPWSATGRPHPASLSAFTDFVGTAIRENSSGSLDRAAAMRFVAFLATHGFNPRSAQTAVRQLLDERRDGGIGWKRALVLDGFAYDVFRSLVRRHDVAYATFFSNTTAHFQHYFWRNFRPDTFTAAPPADDHESLTDAVATGYRNHDQLLGRIMADFPQHRIVFVTALSQQPWDTDKCTYRPRDFDRLVDASGLDRTRTVVEPIMAEEFFLSFPDSDAREAARETLAAARVGDRPLFRTEPRDGHRLKVACDITTWADDHGDIVFGNGRTAPFGELFHRIHGLRSGRHHPDGCLWIQSAAPRRVEEKVPLTAVAPTILRLFSVDAPSYMKEPALRLAEFDSAGGSDGSGGNSFPIDIAV